MMKDVRVFGIALFSALGAFLFGLDIGYIAPILECESFKRDVAHLPDAATAEIPAASSGAIVAIFSLGCIVSCFPPVSAYVLDEFGRKAAIIAGGLVFFCGCALQAQANALPQMLLGRFVAGLSVGLLSSSVVLYQSELAPPHLRGALTALYQLMITLGILAASFLDFLLVGRDGGWRLAIWLQAIPAVLLALGMLFMPRSPRWLMQQHQPQAALEVLRSLRGSEDAALEEWEEMKCSMEKNKELGDSGSAASPTASLASRCAVWQRLLAGRSRRPLLVAVTLILLQQFSGMNALMYFGPRIFESAGPSSGGEGADYFQNVLNFVNFLATIPALVLTEHLGRRRLLLVGAVGMALSCLVLASSSAPRPLPPQAISGDLLFGGDQMPPIAPSAESFPTFGSFVASAAAGGRARQLAAAVLFVASYACSWGPVVWVYCAEIFPLHARGLCMAVVTSACWTGNLLIAQFTPMLLEAVGLRAFYGFAIVAVWAFVVALWLPETQGLTLERIDDLLDAKLGVDERKPLSTYGAVAARAPYSKTLPFLRGNEATRAASAFNA